MYRIHFDPSTAKFVIQVLTYGIFWKTVGDQGRPMQFNAYEGTVAHIQSIGLDVLYQNKSGNEYQKHLIGASA